MVGERPGFVVRGFENSGAAHGSPGGGEEREAVTCETKEVLPENYAVSCTVWRRGVWLGEGLKDGDVAGDGRRLEHLHLLLGRTREGSARDEKRL